MANATVVTVQAVLSGEPRSDADTDEIAGSLRDAVEASGDVARAVVVGVGIAAVPDAPAPGDVGRDVVSADDEPF